MAVVQFALLLASFSVFGVSSGLACSGDDIQACILPIMELSQTGATQNMDLVCAAVKKAMTCVKNEIDSCPSSYQAQLNGAKQAIMMAGNACDDPSIVDTDDMATCDAEKLNECSRGLQGLAQSHNKAASCRGLGKVYVCIREFTSKCKSDYVVKMIAEQQKTLDAFKEMCESESYAISSGSDGNEMNSGKGGNGENGGQTITQKSALSVMVAGLVMAFRYFL